MRKRCTRTVGLSKSSAKRANRSSTDSMWLICCLSIAYLLITEAHLRCRQRLEAERLLTAGASARLAADAVVRVQDGAKHLGGLFFVHLLRPDDAVRADLHTTATADTLVLVYRPHKARCPFASTAGSTSNVSHA